MKGHQGSRSGAGPNRLRRRDRRAATSAAINIGVSMKLFLNQLRKLNLLIMLKILRNK